MSFACWTLCTYLSSSTRWAEEQNAGKFPGFSEDLLRRPVSVCGERKIRFIMQRSHRSHRSSANPYGAKLKNCKEKPSPLVTAVFDVIYVSCISWRQIVDVPRISWMTKHWLDRGEALRIGKIVTGRWQWLLGPKIPRRIIIAIVRVIQSYVKLIYRFQDIFKDSKGLR